MKNKASRADEAAMHAALLAATTPRERLRARDRFFAAFAALPASIANRYRGRSGSLSTDDLAQEGAIGMLAAIERYEPTKGPFVPFATLHIRSAIAAAISGQGAVIAGNAGISADRRRVQRAEAQLAPGADDDDAIAELASMSLAKVQDVRAIVSTAVRPDMGAVTTAAAHGEEPRTAMDHTLLAQLRDSMAYMLTAEDQEILLMHMDGHTLTDISAATGRSRNAIKTRVHNALELMKWEMSDGPDEQP